MQQQEQTGSMVCLSAIWIKGAQALSSKHIWCLFAPILNIASKLGLPEKDRETLERVQRRAAYWIAGCTWNKVMHQLSKLYNQCLSELALPTLTQCCLFLLSLQIFKIVHCLDCIKFQNYFSICKNQHPRTRSYHPLHFLTCASRVNPYRYSFFVNAPFIWNALPGSILCILCPVTFRSSFHFCLLFLCVKGSTLL